MTVLVTQDLPGVTDADYAGLVSELGSKLAEAPGFISHAAGPVDGGWRVNELWESKEAHSAWYSGHVVPIMPGGAPPTPVVVYQITNMI